MLSNIHGVSNQARTVQPQSRASEEARESPAERIKEASQQANQNSSQKLTVSSNALAAGVGIKVNTLA